MLGFYQERNDRITHPDSHSKKGVGEFESHDSREDGNNACAPEGVEVIEVQQHTSFNEKNLKYFNEGIKLDNTSFEQVHVTFQEENSSLQQTAASSDHSRNIQVHSCISLNPKSTAIQSSSHLRNDTQNRGLATMNVEYNGMNVEVKESTQIENVRKDLTLKIESH